MSHQPALTPDQARVVSAFTGRPGIRLALPMIGSRSLLIPSRTKDVVVELELMGVLYRADYPGGQAAYRMSDAAKLLYPSNTPGKSSPRQTLAMICLGIVLTVISIITRNNLIFTIIFALFTLFSTIVYVKSEQGYFQAFMKNARVKLNKRP